MCACRQHHCQGRTCAARVGKSSGFGCTRCRCRFEKDAATAAVKLRRALALSAKDMRLSACSSCVPSSPRTSHHPASFTYAPHRSTQVRAQICGMQKLSYQHCPFDTIRADQGQTAQQISSIEQVWAIFGKPKISSLRITSVVQRPYRILTQPQSSDAAMSAPLKDECAVRTFGNRGA